MKENRNGMQEAAEDIFFGQVVINWARWFLIVGGTVLVLWTAANINQLVLGILPVMALMGINFYLHGRHLGQRPANPALITMASTLDLAVITMAVLFWPDSDQRGLGSPFFVFYYPVLLAFAFVMRPRFTALYTLVALSAYAGACLLADTSALSASFDVESLLTRLITLGAMGALGTYYWRIQRNRRLAPVELATATHNPEAGHLRACVKRAKHAFACYEAKAPNIVKLEV